VKNHSDRASDTIPTRLAASLAALEADLDRLTATRGR
jgi:hypothetical protein